MAFLSLKIFKKLFEVLFLTELRIVIPQEAGLAVLKGAVVYGHNPTTIDERIAKYTDRIENSELVDPKNTKIEEERDINDGKDKCSIS